MTKVLAIETSCDETAASVVSNKQGIYTINSNVVASQIKDHSKWGGVVPELAARKHLELIHFVISEAIEVADVNYQEIDVIASTVTPGLVGSLRIGSIAARTLCAFYSKPFCINFRTFLHLKRQFLIVPISSQSSKGWSFLHFI